MARILIGNVRDMETLQKLFAPAGYGLGVDTLTKYISKEDMDNTFVNGLYWVTCIGSQLDGQIYNYGVLKVSGNGSTNCIHEFYPLGLGKAMFRQCDGGTWRDWDQLALKSSVAPAGYGLGAVNGHDCQDCNAAVLNGTYYLYGESTANHPGSNMQYGCMEVKRRGNYITQIIHYDYHEAKRFSKDGGTTWGEWEWVNPPMEPGVEYRTTERWRGKVVYTTLIDFDFTTEGTTSRMLPFGGLPIRYSASANGVVSPYHPNSEEPNNYFEVHVDGISITVNVGRDAVGKQCFVQLWYAVF